MNTETNELINNQKRLLDGLDKEHKVLLLADGKVSQYGAIKEIIQNI